MVYIQSVASPEPVMKADDDHKTLEVQTILGQIQWDI